jgi:hypothetical protein
MAKAVRAKRRLKLLFIGNSFTARNDLPGLVADLMSAGGVTFEHELISAGGASLRRHWNGGVARQAIESGGWDYVVLQEQSTLPIKNAQRFHESVRLFDPAIRAAGARTALYMTWARRHAPETQSILTRAYREIADELGATLIPVGDAWKACLRRRNAPDLFDRDGSHPSLAGSYLAACVMYLGLTGSSDLPELPQPADLSESELKTLIDAASRAGGYTSPR